MTRTEPARRTALRAAWLFDGTETLKPDPLVVLDGASIVSVDFGATAIAPTDLDEIDLGDATLLPGLIDTHVHLAFDATLDPVASLSARTDEDLLAAMRAAGRTALAGGVTTVRDLGDRDYLSLRLRGDAEMPTLVSAGPPITTEWGHCHFLGGVAAPGAEGVRAAVREHAERGVDVIKVMATGGTMTPGTHQHEAQFSEVELRAAVDEAHRWGLPITAHAHGTQGIKNALAAGVDGLEHATFWAEDGVDDPGEVVARIVDQRVVVGATVGLVPVPGSARPAGVTKRLHAITTNFRLMRQAGVRIVAGSDAGIAPEKPHDVLRHALPQLMGVGMSAAEALRTITADAADVCGLGDRKGQLAVGHEADILVVRGNPLTSPESIPDIVAVYCRGQRVGG